MVMASSSSCCKGLRKVTNDMKSKNRTDRTGVVAAEAKEPRNVSAPSSTKGPAPAKLELQMGRK
jgi:adenylyl cyclase-associated protein